jgi:predicted RND superfamily exporter protein
VRSNPAAEPGRGAISMLRAYSQAITRHAVWVLLGIAALTALALTQIIDLRTGLPRLVIDTSIEQMLPSGDDNRTYYDRVRKVFGNDETLLLVLHRPGSVFTEDLLAAIARLTPRVAAVPGVASVLSLSSAPNISSIDGDLIIAPLFDSAPSEPAELEAVRTKAFSNPLYAGSLVNASGDTTSLVIQLLDIPESEFTRLSAFDALPGWLAKLLGVSEPTGAERAVDRQIQALAAEELGADVQSWLVGSAHIKAETTRTLIDDLVLTIPLALLLIALVAGLSFRTVRGVVLPVCAIGVSVIWTLGVMAAVDPLLNLVTVSVPMLLLVIGFAYAVHVMSCYYHAVEEGPSPEGSAAARALEAVLLPTLVTSLTTLAGFFSLVTHPLAAIRQFGLYGGIGVGLAGVAAITFVPAVLQLLRTPPAAAGAHGSHTAAPVKPFDRLLAWLGDFDCRHATAIFMVVAVLSLLSGIGIPRIQVNSTMVSNFPPDSPVRLAVEAVNRKLGGAGQINVVLETDYPKGFTEPSILKQLEELQTWLAEQPAVSGSTSILDYVKLIHQGFNDNDPAQYRIPASRNLVTQLLFFGGSDDTKRFVDSQYQIANVLVRTTALDSADLGVLVRRIEQRLAELKEPLRGRVTGNLVLIARTNDEIAFGQAISVASAFGMIFVIMAALFMSVRVGFIAMVPNVFPVLLYFGVLGWTGITLNVTTGLVASIVLGISVDDTIHFFSNFNRLAREKANEIEGVKATLLHLGRPVTYASLALCAGFAVLGLSDLQQQAEFGWLAAGTLVAAGVADLTFNPALTSRVKIVTLWDVLSLDLGENPHQVIPLFHGFSKWQARIVALMTEIVETKGGHRLMQTGQKSDGMYLVIEGQLQSSIERDGVQVPLNRHGRGDVLGEVGLFRGERTANVDCQTDCRLLRFDQENLARLQRRYSRTAAKLMRNLSEVLADRLKAATQRVRG